MARKPAKKTRGGFLMLMRGATTTALAKDPYALALLTQIALRAHRPTAPNPYGLAPGEALIGADGSGMTEKTYRGAKDRLSRLGLVAFRTHESRKGTVAKIENDSVYALNLGESPSGNGGENGADLGADTGADLGADTGADPQDSANPAESGTYGDSPETKGGPEGGPRGDE